MKHKWMKLRDIKTQADMRKREKVDGYVEKAKDTKRREGW